MTVLACRYILTAVLLLFSAVTAAHKHHDILTDEEAQAPVDAILWMHMTVQAFVWGVLFPIGMVLGLSRSRWHVPLQGTGFVLTAGGYILGHSHKGRQFLASVHGTFASLLLIPIILQLSLGVYLKLHIHERTIRPYAVIAHGIVGKSYPILGWIQMVFGVLTFRGYCRGDNLGQCLAHYIMGSGFIAYASIMAIILLAGETWVRRSGKSPEWWDSWVITLWGVVNTFTEHHGGGWSVKDMQHTILGVLWWTGGILGIFLSRNNQRNIVPGLIIILTGWAMSQHAQTLMLSTKVHTAFGQTLMLAGLTRIIEICFFIPNFSGDREVGTPTDLDLAASPGARDGALSSKKATSRTFRHLPPFLLVAAGLLFMSATDEELRYVHENEMDHVTYILIMFSVAFILYAFILLLLHLYSTTGRNASKLDEHENVEMTASMSAKWYTRVPTRQNKAHMTSHVIGGLDEEDEMTPL